MLDALREEVCELNRELPRLGLAAWTTGNLSARDPETGLVAIKPSGMRYEHMTPADIVVVDLDGSVVEGPRTPSVDTASHLAVYRGRADVGGVVHTHSPYATAFAAVARPIPVVLTSIADQFGGPVPVGGYVPPVGGDAIGVEILRAIGTSPAVLLKNHGVFTIGPTASKALQAAVMVEENARTVAIALSLGTPDELPAEDVERQRAFYLGAYGQTGPDPVP
jgi:ribulose-5-phosphate 4-epimerase/fuculose-1-phosphate aldolase